MNYAEAALLIAGGVWLMWNEACRPLTMQSNRLLRVFQRLMVLLRATAALIVTVPTCLLLIPQELLGLSPMLEQDTGNTLAYIVLLWVVWRMAWICSQAFEAMVLYLTRPAASRQNADS